MPPSPVPWDPYGVQRKLAPQVSSIIYIHAKYLYVIKKKSLRKKWKPGVAVPAFNSNRGGGPDIQNKASLVY